MRSSRRSQESLFFPWALLLGAAALAACSSSKQDGGYPDADVADAASTDLQSSDTRAAEDASTAEDASSAEDASTAEAEQPCTERGEASCTASASCFAIRGLPFVDLCQGRRAMTFAGCVSGGPDGGTMITWGRQEATGQIFQFPTTQMPAGWVRIAEPACGLDGGVDTALDSAGTVDGGSSPYPPGQVTLLDVYPYANCMPAISTDPIIVLWKVSITAAHGNTAKLIKATITVSQGTSSIVQDFTPENPVITLAAGEGSADQRKSLTSVSPNAACVSMCSGATYQLDLVYEIDGQSIPASKSGAFSCVY